ncbi:MAG TPA: hypothetical protein VJS85_10895, partial [Rhizomicrobium sp.]|nr:hypothetical protein [Rhizomicrobium sp.]
MNLFNRNDKPGSDKPGDAPARPQAQASPSQGSQSQGSQPQARSAQTPQAGGPKPPPGPVPLAQSFQPPSAKTGAHMASVISKALKITGQL